MAVSVVGTRRARLLIGGKWGEGRETFDIFDMFTGEIIGQADSASEEQVHAAVQAAVHSFQTSKLDPHKRYKILMKVYDLLEKRRDEIAQTIIAEAGFPMTDAANEVRRSAELFVIAAEEGKRLTGE